MGADELAENTKARKFGILMKKGFIGRLKSVVRGKAKNLELEQYKDMVIRNFKCPSWLLLHRLKRL